MLGTSLRLFAYLFINGIARERKGMRFHDPQTNALVTAVSIKIRTEHRFENPERESFLHEPHLIRKKRYPRLMVRLFMSQSSNEKPDRT